jgi:hypothetical protein
MSHKNLLQEMRDSVGQKDPVVFFEKMVSVFEAMFHKLEGLEKDLNKVKTNSALSIQWDSKVASDMLIRQIQVLREDSDTYFAEIHALKNAFKEDTVTQNYNNFCKFWVNCLGWHPFLDYDK